MTLTAALLSCSILGLQHGVDWDHVAAISDITSVQSTTRDATLCGLYYALGHAATVALLGIAVLGLKQSLPDSLGMVMQKVVGFTLILLGVYVVASLMTGKGPLSRGQAILRILGRLHAKGEDAKPADSGYGPKSSMSLGVLHGIGAETPTQVSMLVIATNSGGLLNGIPLLVAFAVAMFISNMALTGMTTSAFGISRLSPALFRRLGALTSICSIWLGSVLVLSRAAG
jgi:high-affinity nickel-transport protein